jgi:hypothetical protein
LSFTVNVAAGTKQKATSVTIVITELDLPPLSLQYPSSVMIRRVNLDEEFRIDMNYPTNNPDSLFYGGALLYDLNIVSTMKFLFTTVKFQIEDYFSTLMPNI